MVRIDRSASRIHLDWDAGYPNLILDFSQSLQKNVGSNFKEATTVSFQILTHSQFMIIFLSHRALGDLWR